MKVILKDAVKKLGEKGQIVNVSDGYARNFLFRRNLAVPVNESSVKTLDSEKKDQENKIQRLENQAKELAAKLGEKTFKIKAKAGGEGRLFGSITTQNIVDAVKEQSGQELSKKDMVLEDHIKQLGRYKAKIRLYQKISAEINFEVVSE